MFDLEFLAHAIDQGSRLGGDSLKTLERLGLANNTTHFPLDAGKIFLAQGGG